ncbi:unnamed protein product [Closterium sp. NIES-64]|nr:unnamed protein product [Closterium sp. NIES-64]
MAASPISPSAPIGAPRPADSGFSPGVNRSVRNGKLFRQGNVADGVGGASTAGGVERRQHFPALEEGRQRLSQPRRGGSGAIPSPGGPAALASPGGAAAFASPGGAAAFASPGGAAAFAIPGGAAAFASPGGAAAFASLGGAAAFASPGGAAVPWSPAGPPDTAPEARGTVPGGRRLGGGFVSGGYYDFRFLFDVSQGGSVDGGLGQGGLVQGGGNVMGGVEVSFESSQKSPHSRVSFDESRGGNVDGGPGQDGLVQGGGCMMGRAEGMDGVGGAQVVQGDKAEEKVKAEQDKEEEEAAESIHDDLPVPTAFESLLMELCDETNIAELRIKIGKMELHVLRDVGGVKAAQAQAYAPHAPLPPMFDSLSPTSLAAASAPPAPVAAPPAVAESEAGVDEGLQYVTSPRVGIMRRGRQVKGKKGKPLVAEGSEIKKGQVVCYLEQLGTQLAIESENAGEVVKFLVEDGDAVGFGDALVAIRPSFPGIKKLAL